MEHHLAPLGLRHLEFAEVEGFRADFMHRSFVWITLRLGVGAAHCEAPGWNRDEFHLGLDRPHPPRDEARPHEQADDRQCQDRARYAGDTPLPIAPSGAAGGGDERCHLLRQRATPAGAERQTLGEAQPAGSTRSRWSWRAAAR